MSDTDFIAKIAFEAYSNAVGGTNVAGNPIPPWEELGEKVQGGWTAAVNAMANYLLDPNGDDFAAPGDY